MHGRNSSEFLLALDSIQARSQFFFFMGKCDPKRRRTKWGRRGKSRVGGGGGGVDLECVNVCHLGLSGGMLFRKIFNFKPSEMAENEFKTNMV